METSTLTVAKINNVEIVVIKNGSEMVPVKPICEALGIDFSGQLQRIKSDEILSSVMGMTPTTGSDGKVYEMASISFEFIFGWLFTIDTSRVKPEAKEAVIKYKLACYKALYEHFVGAKKFLELKEKETERLINELKTANKNYFTAKTLKHDAEEALSKLSKTTFQDYLENNRQLKLNFDEGGKNE